MPWLGDLERRARPARGDRVPREGARSGGIASQPAHHPVT
jgi:hypothetical protein